MAKLTAPLFSLTASKQLGRKLIYRTSARNSRVVKYYYPGSSHAFSPSVGQLEIRDTYRAAISAWRALSDEQKNEYRARARGLVMTGWNLFVRDYFYPPTDETLSFFGVRLYGVLFYGNH